MNDLIPLESMLQRIVYVVETSPLSDDKYNQIVEAVQSVQTIIVRQQNDLQAAKESIRVLHTLVSEARSDLAEAERREEKAQEDYERLLSDLEDYDYTYNPAILQMVEEIKREVQREQVGHYADMALQEVEQLVYERFVQSMQEITGDDDYTIGREIVDALQDPQSAPEAVKGIIREMVKWLQGEMEE